MARCSGCFGLSACVVGSALLREVTGGGRGRDIRARLAPREQQAGARHLAIGDQLDRAADGGGGRISERQREVGYAEIEEVSAEVVRGGQALRRMIGSAR